jgi:hypothetical protein
MDFQKPIQIKIADQLFLRFNLPKKHFQVTDLTEKYAHYSLWLYGYTVDFHKTLNPHHDHPKQQIPIFKRQLDLDILMQRVVQELAGKNSPFQIGKADDSRWRDLDIEFVPTSTLTELMPTLVKGQRLNFSKDFLAKFEELMRYAKLKELTDCPVFMGKASEDQYVVTNGTDCMVCDIDLLSKTIERNLQNLIVREPSNPS